MVHNFPVLRRRLRRWFATHGRDYPWRKTDNWFHLLMAEMMLRRTRADQVVPVYLEFTGRYADPLATARLPRARLKGMLYPLGLAWRAEHILETLRYLRQHHPREAPPDLEALRRVPGVGEYSAAMLANRLHALRIAAVDVNVARVHSRLVGQEPMPESRRKVHIIALANRFVRSPHAAELNLAVLDLAALVCQARRPLCSNCPFQKHCATGRATLAARHALDSGA